MSQSPTEMFNLLESWGLADLKSKFKANYIVLQALEYLTEADIIELIPKIGQRAIFRARLNQWRQQQKTSINVPEPKKIKLEPGTEIKSPPAQQPFQQEIQQQLENQQPIEQNTTPQLLQPQNVVHKIYGNLTKVTPKPRARKNNKKANNAGKNTQTPNMQSRVQQFIIGSPPQITSTATLATTTTGTGICRLPSPTAVAAAPTGGTKIAISSPTSLFYNLPPHIECRRFPSITKSTSPQMHSPIPNQIHNIVSNSVLTPVSVQNLTPISSRIINSDNLLRLSQPNQTGSNFEADLTPFATSIIRVETNCETQYPNAGDPSSQNPVGKFKRTTIIQKLTPDKKTTKPQLIAPKPLIMPKPIETLQNPQVVQKSPESAKSPEVPKPKTILIPKEEPIEIIEDNDEDTWNATHSNEFDEKQTHPVNKLPFMEKEPETDHQHETIPETEVESEQEAEQEQEPNPEVEEFTLADAVTEIPDLIKDELLDSDSRSDHEDNDNNNEKGLLTEMKDFKDSQESQNLKKSGDTQEAKGDITRLDIRNVLMTSKLGRRVIKRYVAEEILDEGTRRLLVEVVAQYCFDNKIHITPTYCKDIAEEIIEIFPNERMEDYWVRKGRKLRPPIYNKFHCIRRDFFRRKALTDAHAKNNKEIEKNNASSVQDNDYDDDDNLIIS
ncbi:uncharacterized protein LOC129953874 isoform X2 [Eupeodes corollae]|uniref:uncharacterized protein LOC129953874 isoform X2 n=1 Tax=Eupeodes corollae TaxID=290404 RepID=UPI0024936EC3|nr:uncharacterized protein LOC129953874 isoform X2 [Eupeodes corollae]